MSSFSLATEEDIQVFLNQSLTEQNQMSKYALAWIHSIQNYQSFHHIHPQSASLYSIQPHSFYTEKCDLQVSESKLRVSPSPLSNSSIEEPIFPLFKSICSDHVQSSEKKERQDAKMLGVLLVQKGNTRFLLRAFSGQVNNRWFYSGWAPPLFDESSFAYESWMTQLQLHHLTHLIQNPSGSVTQSIPELKHLRKRLSQSLTKQIHQNYHFYLPSQKRISLYNLWPKAPTGTGECCAPKLLSWCYQLQARPLGLTEFWWDGSLNQDKSLSFHLPCLQRCAPILPTFFS